MTDTFRALCAELLAAIQLYTKLNPAASEMSATEITVKLMDAMAATAAALAEQPVGATDEELRDFAAFDADFDCYETTDESGNVGNAWECSDSQLLDFARAVLARWGQP
jgi:hypothetical protein